MAPVAEIPRILEPLWPKIGQQQGVKARVGGEGGELEQSKKRNGKCRIDYGRLVTAFEIYVEREIEDVTLTRRQKEMCEKNECPQDSKQGSVK